MIKGTISRNLYYVSLLAISVIWAIAFYIFTDMATNDVIKYKIALEDANAELSSQRHLYSEHRIRVRFLAQLQVMKSCAVSGFHIMEDLKTGGWLLECEDANVKRLSDEDVEKIKVQIQKKTMQHTKTETETFNGI